MLGYGLAMFGMIGFLCFWMWRIGTVPDAEIPTPRLPTPNAHDTYVAAGNALQDSTKIGFAIATRHYPADPNDRAYTLAEKQAFLDENKAVLAQIRTGLTQTYYAPPVRSPSTLMPYYAKFRGMARLLRLEQQTRAARGDWNGNVQSGLDAVQMGAQIPRGSLLLGDLVGIAMQAIGRSELWADIEHLNARECRDAIARMQTIRALRRPTSEMLQEEEWFGIATLREAFQQPDWQKGFLSSQNVGSEDNAFQDWLERTRLMFYGKRGITLNYIRYMDQTREAAKERVGTHPQWPELPNDPVSQMLIPMFGDAAFKDATNEVENDMLLLTLCLCAYRLEHGAYPPTLAALAPDYLPQLPEDPFAAQGGYTYRPNGATYALYSIGPDGKDDGGTPIDDKSKITAQFPNSRQRYLVLITSKGDIVAGVNR
jgi:hypothetical protein